MNKAPLFISIFSAAALAGCQWTVGTAGPELEEDLTCHSEIVDQTIVLEAGEKLYDYSTNTGQPYYGLTREFKDVERDGALTITTEISTELKMYDHDRWHCENDDGVAIDYKTLNPL